MEKRRGTADCIVPKGRVYEAIFSPATDTKYHNQRRAIGQMRFTSNHFAVDLWVTLNQAVLLRALLIRDVVSHSRIFLKPTYRQQFFFTEKRDFSHEIKLILKKCNAFKDIMRQLIKAKSPK